MEEITMKILLIIILSLTIPLVLLGDLSANISVVNYFDVPQFYYGIETFDTYLDVIDTLHASRDAYNYSGNLLSTNSLTYSNPHPYGVCYSGTIGGHYYNDTASSSIYYYQSGWQSYLNPAGNKGRGMDYDGTFIWETFDGYGSVGNRVYYFFEDGSNDEYFSTPEPGDGLSGLGRFSYNGIEYVILTTESDHNFYFYRLTGTYAGSESIPFSLTSARGIDYCENRDTFFLNCDVSGVSRIYELDFDFYESSINLTSIGQIKNLFK
jgi:hypothetical protein